MRLRPWFTPNTTWSAIDDRIRGGSSQSHLDVLPAPYVPPAARARARARFHGTLDTSTLGGAGFASQATRTNPQPERGPYAPGGSGDGSESVGAEPGQEGSGDNGGSEWDLSAYDGLRITIGHGDGKRYTLTLKDALPETKREDGREKAGVSWEVDFEGRGAADAAAEGGRSGNDGGAGTRGMPQGSDVRTIEARWADFRATYRGRDRPDGPPLDTARIKRFSLLMRSFFDEQQGDFDLEVWSISAFRA